MNIIIVIIGIFIGTSIATFITGLIFLKMNRMGDSKGEYYTFADEPLHVLRKERSKM